MKGRTVVVLALIGLALVLAAIWIGSARAPESGAVPESGLLLPALEGQLNAIDSVRIVRADGETVLARDGERWLAPGHDGWPADTAKLRELLLGLAQARTIEAKTANPELYPRLGVEAVGEGSGSGALIELSAGDSSSAVIIGTAAANGSYARLADQPQSWLLDRRIAVDTNATAWLARELAQIDAQRVASVRVTPAEGEPVEIVARDPGPGFDIANLPKGREPASDYVADATAGFLSSLRLDDVARDQGDTFADDAPVSHARFALRDGIVIDVDFRSIDGTMQARFDASLDADRAAEFVTGAQAMAAMEHERAQGAVEAADVDASGDGGAAGESAPAPLAVTDPEADRTARLAALQAEVDALQQRLDGWVFTLPPYKAEHLGKSLPDYLAAED